MTEPLSPAAQAVLDGMYEVNLDFGEENAKLAIAAFRALADRLQYKGVISKDSLIAIATELENHD